MSSVKAAKDPPPGAPYGVYPGQQPPPGSYAPPGTVTYIQTPVYGPGYPPQATPVPQPPPNATYVTNIYQQPPADPVNVVYHVESDIDWVQATTVTARDLQHKALVAGKEGWDSSPLCVIRAHHAGEFIPGKLAIKHRAAYVPHMGKEVPVHNFEVLCAKPHAVRWLTSGHGQVPPGAIPAGNTHNGEPLYIARVKHLNSLTPGKVHPSHNCAYISFGGKEISYKTYEVLCKIVG